MSTIIKCDRCGVEIPQSPYRIGSTTGTETPLVIDLCGGCNDKYIAFIGGRELEKSTADEVGGS